MRVLFIARQYSFFRNYESVVRELSARGHEVHLAVERGEALGGVHTVEALARECEHVSHEMMPEFGAGELPEFTRRLRLGLDYLRYLDPFYDALALRRVRARERTPRALIWLVNPPLVSGRLWRRWASGWLQGLDRAVPPPEPLIEYLANRRPDVLLLTPLVDLGSQQVDVLRAARGLGIPTALCVWSWDHLSSKAYLREYPERIFVWNDSQKGEATDIHHAPPARLRVTGAQNFDQWFERIPSRTREAFCHDMGLPVDRPFVLWVCSALVAGSPPEADYVQEWLQALRASPSPTLAETAVLVRPYPTQMAEWSDVNLDAVQPVAVRGGNPVERSARDDYFDALYHSAAVVGINTTALIEAAIVGRPVLTILPPRFHDTQQGSVHFQHLLNAGGGLLQVADDIPAHLVQLERSLRAAPLADHPHRAFLEAFVRPRGLSQAATPVFADEVEALQGCPIDPRDVPPPAPFREALVVWLARLSTRPLLQPLVLSPREMAGEDRWRAAEDVKEQRRLEQAAIAERRRRAWVDRTATAEAQRKASEIENARMRAEKTARAAERTAAKQQRVTELLETKRRARAQAESSRRWRRRKAMMKGIVMRVYRRLAGVGGASPS